MRPLTLVLFFLTACAPRVAVPDLQPEPEAPSMMVIRVLIDVLPEQQDAFVAHMAQEAPTVRAMAGCERYELFAHASEPQRYLLYEEWASAEAFGAYQASDTLKQSFAVLGPMLAGPADSAYFRATLDGPGPR